MATTTAGRKAAASAEDTGEKLSDWAQDSYKSIARGTVSRTSDFAIKMNDMQKSTFERVMESVGKLQDRTGEAVHNVVKDLKMMPPEGVKMVEEWNHLVKRGRQDFVKSAIKSYDLAGSYFERLKAEAEPNGGKAKAK